MSNWWALPPVSLTQCVNKPCGRVDPVACTFLATTTSHLGRTRRASATHRCRRPLPPLACSWLDVCAQPPTLPTNGKRNTSFATLPRPNRRTVPQSRSRVGSPRIIVDCQDHAVDIGSSLILLAIRRRPLCKLRDCTVSSSDPIRLCATPPRLSRCQLHHFRLREPDDHERSWRGDAVAAPCRLAAQRAWRVAAVSATQGHMVRGVWPCVLCCGRTCGSIHQFIRTCVW